MNLEDIQSTAKTLLDAHAPLSSVPILTDDGTYPQTPDRENALSTEGLVIIIWQISVGEIEDVVSRPGRHSQQVEVVIVVEANRVVNQSATGANIAPELAVREILSALCGKPVNDPFKPANPPWANFGVIDGVNQWIINLTVKSII